MSNDASDDSGLFLLSDNDCVFEFLSNCTRDPQTAFLWSVSGERYALYLTGSAGPFDYGVDP